MHSMSEMRHCPAGYWVRCGALVLALLLLPVVATADEGTYSVGVSRFSLHYAPTDSEINGVVWYPTHAQAAEIMWGPYPLFAVRDAEVVPGRHPLVIISHGSGGSHMGHRDTAQYLAGRGYVVVSLLHPRNNYADDADGRSSANWINRPQHVSTVLDWLLGQSPYAGFIDPERIGVAGHSAGGYTALALAGGVPDLKAIRRHCAAYPDDVAFCGEGGGWLSWLDQFFSGGQQGQVPEFGDLRDARVRAVVLMAPMGVIFSDAGSLSRVTVPVLLFRAERDAVLRYPCHVQSIAEKLPRQPQYLVVPNGGHFSFLAPFPEEQKKTVGAPGRDPEGFDRVAFHERMNATILEFFEKSLPPR